MRTLADKTAAFRALHERPGTFLIPNPWDAGSAKLLAYFGFEALATTSLGLANMLGRADSAVSLDEILANCREIAAAIDLPVNADLEKCGADEPDAAAQAIRRAAEAGMAGGSIEDATGDPAHPIYEFNHAVERVAAAAVAARKLPFPFMFVARAENYLHGRPDLDDTVRRLQAFEAAGAEVLYAPGITSPEDIRTVCASVTRPVNVLMGLKGVPMLSLRELGALGVRRVSIGSGFARAAMTAFLHAAREVREQGTFTFTDETLYMSEIAALFG